MLLNHFDEREFACPCCGALPKPGFMSLVDKIRSDAKVMFVINSGRRCPSHNERVGGVPDSAHVNGVACDISSPTPAARFKIVNAALDNGVTRIGIYNTFVHIDVDPTKPQEVIWYGK